MNKKLILVTSPPACGKTYISKQLAKRLKHVVYLDKDTLITLHGYLRIIPESLCNNFKIINLHPGLITKYPELKGIDPQKKATVLKHSEIGCVLHKVIKEVDSGEILMANSTESTYDVDENIKLLRCISIELWTDYLNSSLRF